MSEANWCLFENDYLLAKPVVAAELIRKTGKKFFFRRRPDDNEQGRLLRLILIEGLTEDAAKAAAARMKESNALADQEAKAAWSRHAERLAAELAMLRKDRQ